MPTQSGASELEAGRQAILSLLQPATPAEPEQPTAETHAEESAESVPAETPPGDTQRGRLKVQQGDREIELAILSDDVDPDSLRIGYLAERDYRQKTMDLAEKRKATEASLSSLDTALSDAKSLIEFDLTSLEADTDLRQMDPEGYLQRLDDIQSRARRYQEHLQTLEAAKAERVRQDAAREQELLANSLPSWLDDSNRSKDIDRIAHALREVGFSNEELSSLTDHRVMLMARKAALYDEISDTDLRAKRDTTPPKSMPAGAAGSTENTISQQERDIRSRLAETGKVKDAAALFKHMILNTR